LRVAHENGVIHRDLKPANIIVGATGSVKIVDFGIAKLRRPLTPQEATEAKTDQLTQTGRVIGTMPYMSPEQIQGRTIDHRSDIFSFGIVLYQMATGKRPFGGESPADLISSILRDDPDSVTQIRADLPRHLWRIIRHCLEKDQMRRYQVTLDLLNELDDLRKEIDAGEAVRQQNSIAVLPFMDMSAERDQQYFCDGIAEELINALTGVEDLRVVARTSAFSFRGGEQDMREIGSALNVASLLEGSVRKAGKQVRITAQLIDVQSGYHLWSERYDREMEDVFAIQDDIAQRITESLKVKLTEEKAASLCRRYTEDKDAYHLYLKGRFHWNRRTEDGFRKGMALFKEAVERDPQYALAFAGLADCHTQLGDYGYLRPGEARRGAEEAARRAIEIDESLAEAHASLAYPTMLYDWDWSAAEREFKRAIELNPDYATAHQLYAECLTAMGRMEEAIAEIKLAHELDPLSLIVSTVVAWVYYRARRYGRAIDQCQRALELDPNFAVAHHLLGWIYDQESRYEEAISEAEKSVELSGRSPLMMASLGYAQAVSGRSWDAREILDELKKRGEDGYVPPYDVALVYMGLGQMDQALRWLEGAYQERYGWLVYLNADPIWDRLRKEPGFTSLVGRIGLPVPGGGIR
jgi:serine/threonine-protein kinase